MRDIFGRVMCLVLVAMRSTLIMLLPWYFLTSQAITVNHVQSTVNQSIKGRAHDLRLPPHDLRDLHDLGELCDRAYDCKGSKSPSTLNFDRSHNTEEVQFVRQTDLQVP